MQGGEPGLEGGGGAELRSHVVELELARLKVLDRMLPADESVSRVRIMRSVRANPRRREGVSEAWKGLRNVRNKCGRDEKWERDERCEG